MTPRLRAITTRSYRCFAEPFRLRLAPLTLVYGWNNSGKSAAVRLVGILADSLRETARAVLDLILSTLQRQLSALRGHIQWMGASRVAPPSSIPQDAPPPVQLEPNGEGCVEKLLANRELFEDVARWYALPEIHRDLRFRPDGTRQRLLLNPMGTSFDIDLADTGSGMGQVLPILTGVALGRASTVSGQAGPGSGMQQSASRAAQSSLLPARSPKS